MVVKWWQKRAEAAKRILIRYKKSTILLKKIKFDKSFLNVSEIDEDGP